MSPSLPEGAPSDLIINDALDTRPMTGADHKREGRAIQELAFRMADDPGAVLPQFVEVALQVTGAASAGLSLYEATADGEVFYWRFLRGSFSSFEGATTPRHFSPCGLTLDRNEPMLVRRPDRVYPWIVEAGVETPEVLLVPLYLDGPEPLGTLWVVAEQEGQFTRDHARVLTELAQSVGDAVNLWKLEQARAPVQ